MKKTYLTIITLVFVVLIYLLPEVANADVKTSISIAGKNIEFNEKTGHPFYDENGRTQVPFRVTLEAIGAEVNWDQHTKTAFAEKDGINIKIPIGEKYILKNGVKINNDTKAIIHDGKTFLPIRVVMEALGYDVNWDGNNNIVKIDKNNSKQTKVSNAITPDSYLDSITGVWYLEKENYFIIISSNEGISGAYHGSEYVFEGKIESKKYDSKTNTLSTSLTIEILDSGSENEIMDMIYVFNKISKDKLKITYENGQSDEYEYISKNIEDANNIIDERRFPKVKSPEEHYDSLVGIWYNVKDGSMLEIPKDQQDITIGPALSFIHDNFGNIYPNSDTSAMVRSIEVKDNGNSLDLFLGVRYNLERWQDITDGTFNFKKNKDGTLSIFEYYDKSITEYVYISKDMESAKEILKTKYKVKETIKKIKW